MNVGKISIQYTKWANRIDSKLKKNGVFNTRERMDN